MEQRGDGVDAHSSTLIRRLPDEVVAQIKSSSTITSLKEVALGLVQNSLDASSSRIEINVDFNRGNCVAEDDGVGILPFEFREGGGLGKPYCTSKFDTKTELYGNKGLFLSALMSVSFLTISSRHRTHKSCNSIIFHNSKVMARHIPAPALHELSSGGHGTRVVVRDLFGNLPVRVKQRATLADSKTESERLWDELKRAIIGLLLGWGRECTLVIKDRSHTFSFIPSWPRRTGPAQGEVYRSSFDLPFSLSLLSQSRLVPNFDPRQWVPAAASSRALRIKGAISLQPSPTKQVQFISLGVQPLTTETGHNVLYEHVNRLFSLSSYGQSDQDAEFSDENTSPTKTGRDSPRGFTVRQLRASRKGIDRWPMFVLKIILQEVPDGSLRTDISNDSGIQAILDVLDVLVSQWLTAHHFQPKISKLERSQSRSPAKDSRFKILSRDATGSRGGSPTRSGHTTTRPGSPANMGITTPRKRRLSAPHDLTIQSKAAKTQVSPRFPLLPQPERRPEDRPATPPDWESGATPSHPDDTPSRHPTSRVRFETKDIRHGAQNLEAMTWTDPITGQAHLINSKTGVLFPRSEELGHTSRLPQSRYASILERSKKAHAAHKSNAGVRESVRHESTPDWLADVVNNWKNPVFSKAENRIPTAGLAGQFGDATRGQSSRVSMKAIEQAFEDLSPSAERRISRITLQRAIVLGQVDKKFILAIIPATDTAHSTRLLILIDQHAADERVKVENLLSALCKPSAYSTGPEGEFRPRRNFAQLSVPLQFQVTSREAELFQLHASHFADWAISYDILSPEHGSGLQSTAVDMDPKRTTLSVTTLPPTISERCRSEPKLLISMLRGEVWKLSESSGTGAKSDKLSFSRHGEDEADTESASWLKEIHTAPVELINLINSRACRSAIMFNDPLSASECEDLVHELSLCAFPFQCAHGRPSMVPLVELPAEVQQEAKVGTGPSTGFQFQWTGDGEPSFTQQWKRWRRDELRRREPNSSD